MSYVRRDIHDSYLNIRKLVLMDEIVTDSELRIHWNNTLSEVSFRMRECRQIIDLVSRRRGSYSHYCNLEMKVGA
jgi:hypothetical protein